MIESAKPAPPGHDPKIPVRNTRAIIAKCTLAIILLCSGAPLIAQDSVYEGEWPGDEDAAAAIDSLKEAPGDVDSSSEDSDSENGGSDSESIAWIQGPAEAAIGEWATLALPEQFRFAGEDDAYRALGEQRFYRKDDFALEYGLVQLAKPDARWQLLFSYDEWGYFEREGEDQLNAALIQRSYEIDFGYANEFRAPGGDEWLAFVGWKIQPRFIAGDGAEWAAVYREGEVQIVEYVRTYSGRDGCLRATAVMEADAFPAALPILRSLAQRVRFQDGRAGSDFSPGDAVAFVSMNEYLEDDIWTDERGGLNSVFAWFEKFVSVYALDSPERWFQNDNSETEPANQTPDWLSRYWFYLALIPVGVFLLWKFDSRRKTKTKRYGAQ